MGKAKYIYFDDEIAGLLEKEDNMSFLINRLLKEHFAKKTDINAIKARIIAVEAQHEALAGSLLEASKKAEQSQKAAEKSDEQKKQERAELTIGKERVKVMLKDSWKIYDSTPEEFEKCWEDLEKGLFKNIAGYCEANGIKKKEKRA